MVPGLMRDLIFLVNVFLVFWPKIITLWLY